jgi:hypothetical protein
VACDVSVWSGVFHSYVNPFVSSFTNITELRRITSSGMLRRVALVRTDVSDELSAS